MAPRSILGCVLEALITPIPEPTVTHVFHHQRRPVPRTTKTVTTVKTDFWGNVETTTVETADRPGGVFIPPGRKACFFCNAGPGYEDCFFCKGLGHTR